MIYVGPAGTQGETLAGLKRIHSEGLGACEIQFTRGVGMPGKLAAQVKKLNECLGLRLSVHAPYYINLAAVDNAIVKASVERIKLSCKRASQMGARYVVFHPGYYMQRPQDTVHSLVSRQVAALQGHIRKKGWKVRLAPETTGKQSQYGSMGELLGLREMTGCHICIDFAHLYARSKGNIDFKKVLKKAGGLDEIHSHFSGIEYTEKGERRHVDIARGFFAPLASALKTVRQDITLISESPVPMQGAKLMRSMLQ
jgi:deoxyribonuclease-4